MRKFLILAAIALSFGLGASSQAGIIDAMKMMKNNKPPAHPFDERNAPPRPDYRDGRNWAAAPPPRDREYLPIGTSINLTPSGVEQVNASKAAVDVFYVSPTVFFSQTAWNADVKDVEYRNQILSSTIRNQASVFNGCCAVYAPFYRQMTLGGYVKWSANSEAASDLAYQDVRRAFEYYLDNHNNGRPFIVAGHSQGSRILRRLIAERIDRKPVVKRLVAAYLIGHWIEAEWYDGLRDIKPCQAANDIRCVISYSSFGEGRNATFQRIALGKSSNYTPETIKRPYTCINPLDWTAGTAKAAKSLNLGAWVYGSGSEPRAIDVGMVSARCKDGALYVSKAEKIYEDLVIPFGNYHNVDYNLFYMNIRENALTRATAFLRQQR